MRNAVPSSPWSLGFLLPEGAELAEIMTQGRAGYNSENLVRSSPIWCSRKIFIEILFESAAQFQNGIRRIDSENPSCGDGAKEIIRKQSIYFTDRANEPPSQGAQPESWLRIEHHGSYTERR
ncbi:MAG: hypothetical protein DMG06_09780 [Acidobacteria bacterium]|nr:MAG: hypothetical protein DMG06_09780 [Acidobacteriota bacterium]